MRTRSPKQLSAVEKIMKTTINSFETSRNVKVYLYIIKYNECNYIISGIFVIILFGSADMNFG